MRPTTRAFGVVDAVALGAVGLWCVWVVVSSWWSGRVLPLGGTFIVAPLVLVLGVLLGRLAARFNGRMWVDLLLLFPLVALLPGVRLSMAPGPAPLGYLNANSAAATQVMALLTLALLCDTRDRWSRGLLGLGIALAAWSVVRHGSIAGIATAVPVALIILLALVVRPRHRWWAMILSLVTITGGATALLWLAAQPSWPPRVLAAFDPVRKVMWEEALALWDTHPLAGGGPGSYAEVNPYAHDTDTIAAHSSLLQTGSELGWMGVGLLALLVLTGLLLVARAWAPLSVVAVAAWTALWVHSLADHLFDYPSVPLLAGAVLGWAGAVRTAPRRPESTPTPPARAVRMREDAS